MGPNPRRLFPYPSNVTSCSFECSDACLFYNLCKPFLYSLPLPLPPPPPLQNPTSPIRLHHSSRLSLALVASASSLAAASLLLLLSCLLSIHLRRRRRRRRSASSGGGGGGGGGVVDAGGFVDEDGGVDHHVWYIRTVGLDEPTIGAIAVWVYHSGEGGVLVGGGGGGGAGCAVCLAEFRDGELLRLLPKCGHAFHVACIDAWLRGHVNCPLCRAPIMAPAPAPAPAPALSSLSPSLSPSSSSASSSDATVSDHDGSDSSDQVEVRGIEEGTDAGDVETGGGNAIEVNSTVELSSSSSRVLSNSQDKV